MGKKTKKNRKAVATSRTPKRCIKLYWIYDSVGWFMGGNLVPVGCEGYAEQHREWLLKRHPDSVLHIEWEEGLYTYAESYVIARRKGEAVQREQPGIRDYWQTPVGLSKALAKVSTMKEIGDVGNARVIDALDRGVLGTNDQKMLDEYREETGGFIAGLLDLLLPDGDVKRELKGVLLPEGVMDEEKLGPEGPEGDGEGATEPKTETRPAAGSTRSD